MTPSLTRILITNDDGIHADGLDVLESIAKEISDDVWVVAPESEQSGAGHSLTLTTPVRLRKLDKQKFAVSGTPTDCVMLAVNYLMKDARPTLVLSGVNRGANLGEDITYSGTVAGAMEGTLAGIPSIAFSQLYPRGERRNPSWDIALKHGPEIVRNLVDVEWPEGVLMNVNFPATEKMSVKGVRITEQGQRDLNELKIDRRKDPRGYHYYWFGLARETGAVDAMTDLGAVRDGYISITPLHLNLTQYEMMQSLRQRFNKG